MKIFIVTSLIESQDDGAEVNIVGVKKTLNEAKELLSEVLDEAKEMYEENDIGYDTEIYNDYVIIEQVDGEERIEYTIFEDEI